MRKRKICIITGSRAEYGLLYWLIKEVKADQDLKLQLIVTGMHLSKEFGLTYKEIEKDFKINKKINIQLYSDTSLGISRSMSVAQNFFAKAFHELKPDIIVVLGDRYEILSAATAEPSPFLTVDMIEPRVPSGFSIKPRHIFPGSSGSILTSANSVLIFTMKLS